MNKQKSKQLKDEQQPQQNFSKGMTLDEYLRSNTQELDQNLLNPKDKKYYDSIMGQLEFQQQPFKSKRLITFQIQQIDQDHYDDYKQQIKKLKGASSILSNKVPNILKINKQQRKSLVLHSLQTKTNRNLTIHSIATKSNLKFRHQSNSPNQNKKTPPKNSQMFRSLYGNKQYSKLVNKQKNIVPNNLQQNNQEAINSVIQSKSIFPNLKKDQKYFQSKNKKQYKEIKKYQNMLASKYGMKFINQVTDMPPILNNFRVEGVKDKYFQRKRNMGAASGVNVYGTIPTSLNN